MPQVLSGKFHSLNTGNVARFCCKVSVGGRWFIFLGFTDGIHDANHKRYAGIVLWHAAALS